MSSRRAGRSVGRGVLLIQQALVNVRSAHTHAIALKGAVMGLALSVSEIV